MLTLTELYRPRRIRFLELWEPGGWRLKIYGIAYQGDRPQELLIELTKGIVAARLPQPAATPSRYGAGFLGVHDGRDGIFVFLNWWENENELHHHVWVATKEGPDHLKEVTASGPVACVWDLALIGFERHTWIEAVLANPDGPDVERYLSQRMDAEV